MEREHEENVLFLLGQMLKTKPEDSVAADNQDEILREKLKLQQEEEIVLLSPLHELLQD